MMLFNRNTDLVINITCGIVVLLALGVNGWV